MSRLRAVLAAFRDLLVTIWPVILLTILGFVVAYQFVKPAPPRTISISTGSEAGAYYTYAKRYETFLRANGVSLEVRTSAGAQENLRRIKNGEVDIAFIQGGVQEDLGNGERSRLRSLGSVAYEPVWIFYRGESTFDRLHQLKSMRIAVGVEGSGSRGLALKLLEANGISKDSGNLIAYPRTGAVPALQKGEVDAVLVVSAPEAPDVQQMLRLPDIKVMSFNQADAYTRRFPVLSKVVLPHGVLDLVRDLPPKDTVLISSTANLVVRDDLHPALINLLLQAMAEVNGKPGFFQQAGEFPSYKDQSLLLADEAQRYYKLGAPFLQRYLPFWMAVLVERLFILSLPVIVLLLPLLRFAPAIYSWRIRSRIFRCYGDLKFMESEIRQSYDIARRAEYLARLDRIEEDAHARNIPLAFSDLLYTLREHINLVREKLNHLESAHSPDKKS